MVKLDKEKLLKEIREKNIEISSIDELIKIDKKYKDLVPIILRHLELTDDESDKQFLVRCLGVRGFTDVTETLIKEFYEASSVSYKWAIGNSLLNIMNKESLETMIKIAQETEHGIARQMIVVAIGKMKQIETLPVLLNLLNDEEITGHVIIALSNFKDQSIIPFIEPYMNHQVKWISNEAKKLIKKLRNDYNSVENQKL